MKTRTERQRAKKAADEAFSAFIRERDHWTCQNIGCHRTAATTQIDCGHLFTRGHDSTRYDPMAAKAQCHEHNMAHEEDPVPFTAVFEQELGEEGLEELRAKHWAIQKYIIADLREIARDYRERARELKRLREVS